MTDIPTEIYYHWLPNHLLVTVGYGLRSASTTHNNAQLCAINIDSLRALCLQAGREWIVRVGILDTSNHATYSTAQGYASLDICSTTIIVSLTWVGLFAQPDHLAPRREPNITILGGVGTNDEAVAKHLSWGGERPRLGLPQQSTIRMVDALATTSNSVAKFFVNRQALYFFIVPIYAM